MICVQKTAAPVQGYQMQCIPIGHLRLDFQYCMIYNTLLVQRFFIGTRGQPHPKYKANFKGAITAKGHTEGSEQPRREQSQPRGTQRAVNSRGGSNHSQGAHRGQRMAE